MYLVLLECSPGYVVCRGYFNVLADAKDFAYKVGGYIRQGQPFTGTRQTF